MITHARKPAACYLLIALHLLLGIGAVFGGAALVLAPNGSLLHMPLALLKHSFFHSFLFPGIILLTLLGIYPLIVAVYLFTQKSFVPGQRLNLYPKTHWAWSHSLYIGFILIIWLTVEMYQIQAIAMIHLVYMGLALLILAVTLLPSVKDYYSKD